MMKDELRLGVIARADHGGLASQTYEVWRNLKPERVLIVDMGVNTRGHSVHPEMYDADWSKKWIGRYRRFGPELEQFLDGLDVVYTAETSYDDRIYSIARNYHVSIVLHGNPELFYDAHRAADAIWAPTDWALDRMPARTRVVPMPVALDQFQYRQRRKCETFFFTAGEAMLDRNGWETIESALFHINRPCKLLFRTGSPQPPPWKQFGKVKVEYLPPVRNYWEVIPEEADVILMPRRYGGLALPVQEAAAMGIPSIMSRIPPQSNWFPHEMMTPAVQNGSAPMKGGVFPLYTVRPIDFATRMNELLTDSRELMRASDSAYLWARSRSWETLGPLWRDALYESYVQTPQRISSRYGGGPDDERIHYS